MAETTNGIVYKIRLANGADQYFQIVAPTNVPPPRAVKWATPPVAGNESSAQSAGIPGLAWGGGLRTGAKCGTCNYMFDFSARSPACVLVCSNCRTDST